MDLTSKFQAVARARQVIGQWSDQQRQELILALADDLAAEEELILEANRVDCDRMGDDNPKKDRLRLDTDRLAGIVQAARDVAEIDDPVGKVVLDRKLENGLWLQKVQVPLGVVGIIYESRPNVTVDAAVLSLRAGNAVVLKGSREAEESNRVMVEVMGKTLERFGLPVETITLLPSERASVGALIEAVDFVDLVIPRGSQGLIEYVRDHSRVPVIETGAGVCHTYVHESADLDKTLRVVENAKTARPSVCNAMDTLLVDKKVAQEFVPQIGATLAPHGVKIFADEASYSIFLDSGYPDLEPAEASSFGKEYLSLQCSVKIVDDFEAALEWIERYSSRHSEAILAEDETIKEAFLLRVDAACVYANASTYFSDGGVFGLGAEIGISTQKLHARGPFALEKLVCEKWVVRGEGQVRAINN